MGLILDTSALIGWLERDNQLVLAAIAAADEAPRIHVVTLGELEDGVVRAIRAGDEEVIAVRSATLGFARDELERLAIADDDPTAFGCVSAHVGRRLSHNDKWIASAAANGADGLATEDESLWSSLDGVAIPDAHGEPAWPPLRVTLCRPTTAPSTVHQPNG